MRPAVMRQTWGPDFEVDMPRTAGFSPRTPLGVRTTGTIVAEGGVRIEKVLFASQPGFWVSGNVYVPSAAAFKPPYPGLIVPCGYTDSGKAAPGYQRAGILGAQAGFVTLVYDPADQGERVEDPARASWRGHNWSGALADRLGGRGARGREGELCGFGPWGARHLRLARFDDRAATGEETRRKITGRDKRGRSRCARPLPLWWIAGRAGFCYNSAT